MFVSLFIVLIKKVNRFKKLKFMKYAESKYHTFEFVIWKFNVVYMNINKFHYDPASNDYYGVIGCANSEYDIVNNISWIIVVVYD